MGILKTIAKGICALVAIVAGLMLVMLVIFTICLGPPGGGADNEIPASTPAISTPTPAPTTTPDPEESSITELFVVRSGRDHQDITVECKHLRVDSNYNIIQIANSDVESIRILGSGNSVGYSCDATPRIDDYGDYNDVWQRWLT